MPTVRSNVNYNSHRMPASTTPAPVLVTLSRRARHLRQQHKLAKDLIREARAGDAPSLGRLKGVFPDKSEFQLADAQLVMA